MAVLIGGLGAIIALNAVARATRVPAAILLVLAGLLYGFLPGPNLKLQPDLVLEIIIPPLLYAAALNSSPIALRQNIRAVGSLSVGLVIATGLAIGGAVHAAVPAVPLSVAVALGAVVSPPDPVAALSIGRRMGMPPKLVTLIEGEGLLNDATALTLLQVAVAAAVSGEFSFPYAVGRFALAVVGGLASGLAVAFVLTWVRRFVGEPLGDNAISLGTPFAAYVLAESFGGSGVLAVVVAGLWFAHRGPALQSGESRLQARPVWRLIEYLLEGFVFLLIGQQLPSILDGLRRFSVTSILLAVAATVGVMLVLRPLWLLANELLPARLHTRLGSQRQHDHHHLSGREVVALSWAGTRGVITLAAAFSVPLVTRGGAPLAGRSLLLLCAYVAVLVTLVLEGGTLGPMLRLLGFKDLSSGDALLRNQARVAAVQAALARLDQLTDHERPGEQVVATLRRAEELRLERYSRRVDRLSSAEDVMAGPDDPYHTAVRLRREMIEAERTELLQWRDSGRLPDRSLRILQRELDHEEGLLPPAPPQA